MIGLEIFPDGLPFNYNTFSPKIKIENLSLNQFYDQAVRDKHKNQAVSDGIHQGLAMVGDPAGKKRDYDIWNIGQGEIFRQPKKQQKNRKLDGRCPKIQARRKTEHYESAKEKLVKSDKKSDCEKFISQKKRKALLDESGKDVFFRKAGVMKKGEKNQQRSGERKRSPQNSSFPVAELPAEIPQRFFQDKFYEKYRNDEKKGQHNGDFLRKIAGRKKVEKRKADYGYGGDEDGFFPRR